MNYPDSDITRGRRMLMVSALEETGKFSQRVLKAMGAIPRHIFVEKGLEDFAYEQNPVAIGAGQTISRPQTVALQSTLLGVESGSRILEIGTGCGYQTAVLYYLGAEIFSIERQEELWQEAAENLRIIGFATDFDNNDCNELKRALQKRETDKVINNKITLRWGDGFEGWSEKAPFDGIIVTCASPRIPEKLVLQLKIGGKMVVPIDIENRESEPSSVNKQQLVMIERIDEEHFKRTVIEEANFVAMLPGTEKAQD